MMRIAQGTERPASCYASFFIPAIHQLLLLIKLSAAAVAGGQQNSLQAHLERQLCAAGHCCGGSTLHIVVDVVHCDWCGLWVGDGDLSCHCTLVHSVCARLLHLKVPGHILGIQATAGTGRTQVLNETQGAEQLGKEAGAY